MITNPSAQTVSMIACTRVRIAYANVASISAATVTAVPSLARTVSGKLQKQAIRAGLSSVAVR